MVKDWSNKVLFIIRFLVDPLEPQSGVPLMAVGSVEGRKPMTIAGLLFQVYS